MKAPRRATIYAERLQERTRSLAASTRRRNRIGNLRLLVFLAAAVLIWYAFHGVSLWWIAGPVAVFIGLVWWQSRIERDAELVRRANSLL